VPQVEFLVVLRPLGIEFATPCAISGKGLKDEFPVPVLSKAKQDTYDDLFTAIVEGAHKCSILTPSGHQPFWPLQPALSAVAAFCFVQNAGLAYPIC
jgi:hypothetical protein